MPHSDVAAQPHQAPRSGPGVDPAPDGRPAPGGNRLDELWGILPEHSDSTEAGVLTIGGVSVAELAERYGTPLHVIDERGLREQARRFVDGLRERWPDSEVLFASKSLPAVGIYALAREEGLSIDVAGGGELRLALAAGVEPERIYFHGNAKTEAELRLALDTGIGAIIIDNFDEIESLERLVARPQRVLLRVIPGVEARTHASQATGGEASKFGLPIDQARTAIERLRQHPLLQLDGVHLHIGSQILNTEQFAEAVAKLATVGDFPTYNVGGGLGVRYTYDETAPTVDEYLDAIVGAAREHLPAGARLLIEPGRSVIARAGVTLYRVTTVKRTGRVFVAVDGGMADQLDIALTGQRYEAVLADRLREPWSETVQLVGRQCESGDLLIDGLDLPAAEPGDLLVLATTGAYSYSMSNNYNGALRPAIVLVAHGRHRLIARRETYDDLLRLHEPALQGGGTAG